MDYPFECRFKVTNISTEKDVSITLFSGLTTFVGPNASGKTQTLKALRDHLKTVLGNNKVRYLS